jgi:hypothetical protein
LFIAILGKLGPYTFVYRLLRNVRVYLPNYMVSLPLILLNITPLNGMNKKFHCFGIVLLLTHSPMELSPS